MPFNIVDAVKVYFTPELISKACFFLEETESGVSKALSGIIPAVLSGFTKSANSTDDEAGDILGIVKNTFGDNTANGIDNFFTDGGLLLNKGLRLVQALFGYKLNGLIGSIASFAGIKNSSASFLLSVAGLLVACVIGKHATDMNMTPASLSSFLHGQRTNIMSMLPARLSGIASLLGLSKLGDTIQADINNTSTYEDETIDDSTRGISWLLWLLLSILFALAIWYFAGRGRNKIKPVATITMKVAADFPKESVFLL